MRRGAGTTYVVTCGLCGQTWQLGKASDHEIRECLFCGIRGALRLGPRQAEVEGAQWVEAWLEPVSH